MIDNTYAKSYTEVLAILKCLSREEYEKIPKSEIDFLEENCDREYEFGLDREKKIEEQNISTKANAVLIILFDKYFATKTQKEKLKLILLQNYAKKEEKKRLTYDTDKNSEIFKDKNSLEEKSRETAVIPYKESIISKLVGRIKSFWRKIWNR